MLYGGFKIPALNTAPPSRVRPDVAVVELTASTPGNIRSSPRICSKKDALVASTFVIFAWTFVILSSTFVIEAGARLEKSKSRGGKLRMQVFGTPKLVNNDSSEIARSHAHMLLEQSLKSC